MEVPPKNIIISEEKNYSAMFDTFMQYHGLHKIVAFSGGSDVSLEGVEDEELQKNYLRVEEKKVEDIIDQAIRKFQGCKIAILSGGTKWGVPKTAILKARKYNLKTIGIYPETGEKHALGEDLLDLSICVKPIIGKSYWGDESHIFAKLLDGVIVYGGGAGTLVEMSHLLKMNEVTIKNGTLLKYIVPISGTGGVADSISFLWGKVESRDKSMPTKRIFRGIDAADFLIKKLELEDFIY